MNHKYYMQPANLIETAEVPSELDTRFPDWKAVSPKENAINQALLQKTTGRVHDLLVQLLEDEEIYLYHSYANAVSIRRLGFNDHGPVHARIVTYNALKILQLMREAGLQTSLELEEIGTYEDSQFAVVLGAFLHDVGMSVGRQDHEWHAINLADPIITRYIEQFYPNDKGMLVVLRSMVHEAIVGHMAKVHIHSVEAGTVLVADGTDMSRGRARISTLLSNDPMVGDIHRYSASSVRRVNIMAGEVKPVCIMVQMDDASGLFQIEEVLMGKIKASPIKKYFELGAEIGEAPARYYLR